MKSTKPAALSSLFRMKKWCGGVVIAALAILLFLSYGLIGTKPLPPQRKQSASDFFRGQHKNPVQPLKSEKVAKSSYQPPLLNLDGLAELFAPRNFSKDELQALLVWGQMRLLLSRSDGLAGTAQGIKEASAVWQDLLVMIEQNKATGNETNVINCPYSVSSVDKIASGSGITLEVPCGLVEDSSITIVGIPDVKNGSFQIELLGSEFLKEPNLPIILCYSVKLPGENITDEPFIVQNTWSKELSWGKEERCPGHRSASVPKVDELVLCNEQTVRSSVEKHTNSTRNVSEISTNASLGSRTSDIFAFVEGVPFTATLWVGLEGFHMTVNGRHETSFAYREKLEPWSVSRVRVAGGLEILSVLAKGLPVSEDHDLVSDVQNLKAPPTKRRRLVMLVGVFSTGNNFERRMALRRSWMQYEAVRSGDVAVRFFIGLHKNSQVNFELWKEAQAYGDVQLMPFVDYYSLITLKTIAINIMGTKILPAKYIMKTDDDAFVRIDEILTSLKGKSSNGLLYGLIAYDSSPHRDKESKWYVNSKEWPHNSYPPWAHGPGYIISRDIAKFIVKGHEDRDLKLFKLEDVAMGIWIEGFKNSGQEVNYVTDERFFNAGCDKNYVLAHYQNPRLVLCLWEKLQKEKQPICCE